MLCHDEYVAVDEIHLGMQYNSECYPVTRLTSMRAGSS